MPAQRRQNKGGGLRMGINPLERHKKPAKESQQNERRVVVLPSLKMRPRREATNKTSGAAQHQKRNRNLQERSEGHGKRPQSNRLRTKRKMGTARRTNQPPKKRLARKAEAAHQISRASLAAARDKTNRHPALRRQNRLLTANSPLEPAGFLGMSSKINGRR